MERSNYDPNTESQTPEQPESMSRHGQLPPPPPGYTRRDLPFKSSAFAVILAFFLPGLGHIYLGFYKHAFTIILVGAALISMLASGDMEGLVPLMGIMLGFLYFYQIFDAGRRASLYNRVLETGQMGLMAENIELPEMNPFFGGVILVVLGIVALGSTVFDISLAWMTDWWPAALIVVGAWMIAKWRRKEEEPKRPQD